MTAPTPSSPLRDHGRALAIALAGLLARPDALVTPAIYDDHAHVAMLAHRFPAVRHAWDLFAFVRPGEAPALRDAGVLPWWTDDGFSFVMFRPLSSVLLAAQLTLGGHRLAHVVSALLTLGVVVAASARFRETLPRGTAFLATALLSLAPSLATPSAWASNQNALWSVLFALVGQGASHRRRPLLAALAFGLSALCGEYAFAMAAYALCLAVAERPPRSLSRSLAPLAVVLLPLMVSRSLGYGVSNTVQYIDPLREPGRWLAVAPGRALGLLGSSLLGQSMGSPYQGAVLPQSPSLTVLALAGLTAAFVRQLRALPPSNRPAALAWSLGALAAVAPVLSAPPLARLLLPASVGVAVFLAVLLSAGLPSLRRSARPGALVLAAALGILHLVVVPARVAFDLHANRESLARVVRGVRAAAPPSPRRERCDVLLGTVDLETLHHAPLVWAEGGSPYLRCWLAWSASPHATLLVRTAERSLTLRGITAPLLVPYAMEAYRRDGLRVGQVISTPAMTMTVLEVWRGAPTALRLDLHWDPSLYAVWSWEGDRLVRRSWPTLGTGMMVPPSR